MRNRFLSVSFVLLAGALAGCGKPDALQARAAAPPKSAIPLAMLPRAIVPLHYQLAFIIDRMKGQPFTDEDYAKLGI